MAAGRRREVEREFRGRVRFERRAFLLMPADGQRPSYDAYVISHRVRAAQMLPELRFAIPTLGQKYPRSSWPAQLLALEVARSAPLQMGALEDALFGAMFRELRDISDPAVLQECARGAGLAHLDVGRALADEELKRRATADHREAQALGIQGIPALVLPGTEIITGAVPLEAYRSALERLVG